jgi:Trk K+ transport system NAD-binding subunit
MQSMGPWRLARANVFDLGLILRQSLGVLVIFLVVVGIGTANTHTRTLLDAVGRPYQPSWPESLYATLQLLLFQQSNQPFPRTDPLGQALFFVLPLLGLLVLVQSVLNFGRRVLDKGSRQQAWQAALASTFSDHIIVCGLGRLGLRVTTRLLEAGYETVIIEQNFSSRFVARALSMKVPVIAGDAREIATLRQAGVRHARGVIADVNGDQTNIEIALAARLAQPGIRLAVRAFSEELDDELDQIFGEDSAFSHSALAAPTIAAAAISREIVYAIPVGRELLGITDVEVQPGLRLEGLSAHDLETGAQVRMLDHCDRHGKTVRRGLKESLRAGDTVSLLGTLGALEEVRAANGWHQVIGDRVVTSQHPTPERDCVLVCGLGKVGYRIVRLLSELASPQADFRVVVVCRDDTSEGFLSRVSGLPRVTLVPGDATDVQTLRDAGLDRAFSVVTATSDDLINLQMALAARRVRPDVHVVVRVFSDALAEELNSTYEIHTTYSTSNLASPTLAAAAILKGVAGGGVDRAFTVAGNIYSSDEFTADSLGLVADLTVEGIRLRRGMLVLSLEQDGASTLLPSLETTVRAGARGIVVAPLKTLEKLAKR